MATYGFTTHPLTQSGSQLMQLPAELRLKILRYLMKSDAPLAAYDPGSTASNGVRDDVVSRVTKSNLELSSHILRCCQQLFYEAHPILYKENTLAISYDQVSTLHMLDLKVHLEDYQWRDAEMVTDLVGLAQHLLKIEPSRNVEGSQGSARLFLRQPALLKFESLDITIDNTLRCEVFIAARMLRNLVSGKNVTVHLPEIARDHTALLCTLQQWRCNSIILPETYAPNVEAVKSVVMGSTVPVDLEISTARLDRALKESFSEWLPDGLDSYSEAYPEFEDKVQILFVANDVCHEVNYLEARQTLLNGLRLAFEARCHDKITQCHDDIESHHEEITRCHKDIDLIRKKAAEGAKKIGELIDEQQVHRSIS